MAYVVRWIPRGPDMSVTCQSMADVVALTSELQSSGRSMELHVLRDDVEIDIDSIGPANHEDGAA